MNIFGSLFQKRKQPAPKQIRDTLFGDMPIDQWPHDEMSCEDFPWSTFAAARSHLAAGSKDEAIAGWREILAHPGLESRHYLQAWHFLRLQREQPEAGVAKQVLGVVVEVGMSTGLDLLAAYADHSARYYNYSGAGVVWDHPNSSLDSAIDQLLDAASEVVSRIGPWEQPRPAAPPRDHLRLSFLTPSGLHFGQGPTAAIASAPLGGTVFELATALMKALIESSR
jgi:hypothetical protein